MPPRRASRRASPRRYRGDGPVERILKIQDLSNELQGLGIHTVEPTPRAAYDHLAKIARGREIVEEMQALLVESVPEVLRNSIRALATAYLGIASTLEAQANAAAGVAAAAGA